MTWNKTMRTAKVHSSEITHPLIFMALKVLLCYKRKLITKLSKFSTSGNLRFDDARPIDFSKEPNTTEFNKSKVCFLFCNRTIRN